MIAGEMYFSNQLSSADFRGFTPADFRGFTNNEVMDWCYKEVQKGPNEASDLMDCEEKYTNNPALLEKAIRQEKAGRRNDMFGDIMDVASSVFGTIKEIKTNSNAPPAGGGGVNWDYSFGNQPIPPITEKKKVNPLLIAGGLMVIGVVAYFIFRKK